MKCQTSLKKTKGFSLLLIIVLYCLVFGFSLLFSQGSASAASVTLAWDESNEAACYKIYYGTASNNYSSVVNVGNVTSHTFADLPNGSTYYFAATAYDASNLESDYSDEITYNATSNNVLYASFTGYGLYSWNGTAWTQINTVAPASITADI